MEKGRWAAVCIHLLCSLTGCNVISSAHLSLSASWPMQCEHHRAFTPLWVLSGCNVSSSAHLPLSASWLDAMWAAISGSYSLDFPDMMDGSLVPQARRLSPCIAFDKDMVCLTVAYAGFRPQPSSCFRAGVLRMLWHSWFLIHYHEL